MIDLPLDSADREAFNLALLTSHDIRIRIRVLDRNENPTETGELTPRVLSGEITIDQSQSGGGDIQIARHLAMTFTDHERVIEFSPENPSEGAVYADNFISVDYGVFVDELQDFVDVPVFWGVVSHFERDGNEATVEALGKEALLLDPMLQWRPRTYRRGQRVTDVMQSILRDHGETRIKIPTLKRKLRKPLSIARHQAPWKALRHLASSLPGDYQLFYDGAGFARVRQFPTDAVWTFRGGEDGEISADELPKVTYDVTELRNTVEVLGPKGEGKKGPVRGVAIAKADHPLSPQSLSRNGKPRYIVELIEADHARTKRDAARKAKKTLDNRLVEALDVQFTCLPIPHIEEGDKVRVATEHVEASFRLKGFTIPLTSDSLMSIGYSARMPIAKRAGFSS